ncbi:hypothetical protein GCM10010360_28710 [Streptomyces nogalater]
MYRNRSAPTAGAVRPGPPPPPFGTVEGFKQPWDVRIGDFLLLGHQYQRIRDMRAVGTSARALHFAGRPPLVMRTGRSVFRPVTYR